VRYGNEAAPANNNKYYLLTLAVEKADIRRTSFSGVAVDLVSTNLYLRRSLVYCRHYLHQERCEEVEALTSRMQVLLVALQKGKRESKVIGEVVQIIRKRDGERHKIHLQKLTR
jgi:hypothetical protein